MYQTQSNKTIDENKGVIRTMKRLLVFCLLLMFVSVGCTNVWRGFWNELTGKESASSKSAEAVVTTGTDIATEYKETGKLDAVKVLELIGVVKGFVADTKKEKEEAPTTAGLLGSMLAIGVGSYLGTRKIRKSPAGAAIYKVLMFIPKLVGLVEDIKKKT